MDAHDSLCSCRSVESEQLGRWCELREKLQNANPEAAAAINARIAELLAAPETIDEQQ